MQTVTYSKEAKRGILRALKGAKKNLITKDNPGGSEEYICLAMEDAKDAQSEFRKNGKITEEDIDLAQEMISARLGQFSTTYGGWIQRNHLAFAKQHNYNYQEGRRQWLNSMIAEFANPVYPRKK